MGLKNARQFLTIAVIFQFVYFSQITSADGGENFLEPEQAFHPLVSIDDKTLKIKWEIAEDYFLYRDAFYVLIKQSDLTTPTDFSLDKAGEIKFDEYLEKEVEIFKQDVSISSDISLRYGKDFLLELGFQGCAVKGLCFPPQTAIFHVDKHGEISEKNPSAATVTVNPEPNVRNGNTLLFTLVAALLGGLVLNLMPCVFPVLSLKALSLASAHGSPKQQKLHGWAYTAGVLISFLFAALIILVARATGKTLGWGFQLQHPVFITFMIYLFILMGLSLSGAFEFGGRLMGVGQSLTNGHSLKSSFFTGVLAALVASPCSAPFMATALAVAIAQPAHTSIAIFVVLGFGMALPFLALSYIPGLYRFLPKPGNWMVIFKQSLSFPMYVTAIWLLWVLSHQLGSDAIIVTLVNAVLIVFAMWLASFDVKSRFRLLKRFLVIAVLLPPFFAPSAFTTTDNFISSEYEMYTSQLLDNYRSKGLPVFIDLTADWCITCKMNEKVAITTDIKKQFKENDVKFLVGDFTRENAEITALLKSFGRSGVPLYLMYPKGQGGPEVLPQILLESDIREAIDRAIKN